MRPEQVFDPLLQQERTSLAWERTAFAGIVVGSLLTRVGASVHVLLGGFGLLQVCASAALLVWSGRHYEDLHVQLRAGDTPTHPRAAMVVGIGATVATGMATVLALVFIVIDS